MPDSRPQISENDSERETELQEEVDVAQGRLLTWGTVIFFVIFVAAEVPYVLESFAGTMTTPTTSTDHGSTSAARGAP